MSQKSNSSPNLNNGLKTKNIIVLADNAQDKFGTKRCLHCRCPSIGDLTEKKRAPVNYCLIKDFMQVPVRINLFFYLRNLVTYGRYKII